MSAEQLLTDDMIRAALKAACFLDTPQSRADMRAALEAAIASMVAKFDGTCPDCGRGPLDGEAPEHDPACPHVAPQAPDISELVTGMSVSVDVSTCDDDEGHRYFGTVTEVMDCPGDKHGLTLLVQDAEPNFKAPAPQALTDEQIAAALEAGGVELQRFMGGIAGQKDCWTTAGSVSVPKIAAVVRGLMQAPTPGTELTK